MGKFASLILSLVFIAACVPAQMPGYIGRVDHPYDRKFQAGYEKIVSAVVYVLKNKGWEISEANPATYERDERYDSNVYQNLLIITDVKKSSRVLYATYMHLNIFIHSLGDNSDVEIRYEAQTPSVVKQFASLRNDHLINDIFDAVEQEIDR